MRSARPAWASGGVAVTAGGSALLALVMLILFSLCARPTFRRRFGQAAARNAGRVRSISARDQETLLPTSRREENAFSRSGGPLDEFSYIYINGTNGTGCGWRLAWMWRWLVAAYRVPVDELSAAAGSQAVHYLRIVRSLAILLFVLSILAVGVVLPVNLFATSDDTERSGVNHNVFAETTLFHVSSSSNWVWVHVGVAVFASVLCLIAIDQLREYLRVYTGAPFRGGASAESGGSVPVLTGSNGSRRGWAYGTSSPFVLVNTVAEGASVQLMHSAAAHTVWIRGLVPRSAIDGAVLGGLLDVALQAAFCVDRMQGTGSASADDDRAAKPSLTTSRDHAAGTSVSAKLSCTDQEEPNQFVSSDGFRRRDAAIGASVALVVQRAADLFGDNAGEFDKSTHVVSAVCAAGGSAFVTFATPQEARWFVAEGTARIARIQAAAESVMVNSLSERALTSRSSNRSSMLPKIPVAVAATAEIASILFDGRRVTVEQAPDSADMNWSNIGVTQSHRALRVFAVNAGLFIVLAFLTAPPAMMTAIPQLATTTAFPDFISEVLRDDKDGDGDVDAPTKHFLIDSILFAFLPTLVVVVVLSALPNLFAAVQYLERLVRKSSEERRIFHKSVVFLLLYILVLPSLLYSATDILVKNSDGTTEQRLQIGFLPNSGAFFVNLLLVLALVSNLMELLRPMDLLPRCCLRNPSDRYVLLPSRFRFGLQYAWITAIFAATLFFLCVVPLVVPIGCFYFTLKYFVDKFNLAFACRPAEWVIQQRTTCDGQLNSLSSYKSPCIAEETLTGTALSSVRYLIGSLVLFLLGLAYYFLIHGQKIAALIIAIVVSVLLVGYLWRQWQRRRFWTGARKRRTTQLHKRSHANPLPRDPDQSPMLARQSASLALTSSLTDLSGNRERQSSKGIAENEEYLRQIAKSSYGK